MGITKKTLNNLRGASKKEVEVLKNMSDKDIDYSDIPETDKEFWKGAKLVGLGKKQITLRLDSDVLSWLKTVQPKGYQTLANAILRREMLAHIED